MEGNLSPGSIIPGAAIDVGASIQSHHQPFHLAEPPDEQGMFPPSTNPMQDSSNVVKSSSRNEDDADDGHHDHSKAGSQLYQVMWTSTMFKLLISAVSYIDEDIEADYGTASGKRKHEMLMKKGTWKLVSSTMIQRGFAVSPQLCEYKFNDLNKRYNRLTDILGPGTCCKVVENPALLEAMNISDELKEEARKILNSKHLHYEEMCSYHHRNRLYLLDDPVLQKSLCLALKTGDDHRKTSLVSNSDEDDQIMFFYDNDYDEFNDDREAEDHEKMQFGSYLSDVSIGMNKMLCESCRGPFIEKNSHDLRLLQLEAKELHIKAQMLKLEHRRLKWLKFSKKKDRELQKKRLDNKRMTMQNERMSLELKLKESKLRVIPKRIQ